jgi:drug/metabolite transporter (DMT)-like permease
VEDRRVWAAFLLLAAAWGTSFLFIKIALRTIEPLLLVSARLSIGLLGLLLIARWRGLRLPRDRGVWRHFLVLGAINTTLPFALITIAESGPMGIDSAVASVLNSTVPLFSIIIAGLVLRMDAVTIGRTVGLLVGFGGVVLLLSRGFHSGSGAIGSHLMVVLAALCYAIGSIYARRKVQGHHPVILAAGQLLVASLIAWVLALALEPMSEQRLTLATVGALLWLGLLGSCVAYILYFHVLGHWGPTRTTSVTYLLPVVGVAAGALFLSEPVDWRLTAGGALILAGVAAVNWQPGSIASGQAADI